MSKKPFSLWTDQDLCDWFDGLGEDYIRSLIDLHDDHDITPRKAFHYVFGDLDSQHCTCQACRLSLSPVPAHKSQSESGAAPAEAGQGQGSSFDLFAQPPVIQPSGSVGELAEVITDVVMQVYHDTDVGEAMCSIDVHKAIEVALAAAKLNGEVGQGQGTITLEQFQRWLENKAHAARAEYFKGPQGETLSQEIERCRPFTDFIERARIATKLLMQFKLEQGA